MPSRGGELLALHRRRDSMASGSAIPTSRQEAQEQATVVICYGGREFTARPSMAEVFFRNARRVLDAGHPELVPLLHEGGVELLLVSHGVAIRAKSSLSRAGAPVAAVMPEPQGSPRSGSTEAAPGPGADTRS